MHTKWQGPMVVVNSRYLPPLEYIVKLLKLSADAKCLTSGKAIHAQLLVRDQASKRSDVVQLNSLIHLYVKCGRLRLARSMFDKMPLRDVFSWNDLMTGYMHSGNYLEVLVLFKNLVSSSTTQHACPNEYVFTTVLSSCSHSGRVREGMQCHGYLFKYGLVSNPFVKSALFNMYARCLHVNLALQVLNTESGGDENDIFLYNSLLNVLVESGRWEEAIEVLRRMGNECMVWDNATYVGVMGLCAQIGDLQLGLRVHARLLRGGLLFDEFVGSKLIDMYGKCCHVLNARKVFDGLQNRNVVVWTSLMSAYLQNRYFEETLDLLTCMDQEDTLPNECTFKVLLGACAGIALLKHGDLLHARLEKLGFKNYVIVNNALINMYSKSGDIDSSYNVFSDTMCRDVTTWNSMICGYSHHGLGQEALRVFQDMKSAGESPNNVTFVGVLSACAHLALVDKGLDYLYNEMKNHKIEPGLEHYTCMVVLYCRAGLLEKAENFMKTTKVKWDIVAWRTLLNSCRVHRNFDLGKRIAESILQMDPQDMGTYTLLSNMHATANMWDGVVEIRKMMKERNIKKEPGASWLEIRNVNHVFVSEGCKHPESNEINKKVQQLLAMIKPLGYVPNISAVLHDVEDEQKEGYLNCHSEKLAIAYGLMKMPSPAPIRIIKNLRMCDDCHTAVKLISKVTNRFIIVRDANRFHHFRDGSCTCADHW